jgi:hypothetical protein
MVVPENFPLRIMATNDDGARVECALCGEEIVWTEEGESSHDFSLTGLISAVVLHIADANHG